MAALTQNRMGRRQALDVVGLPLKAAKKAWIDGSCCADTSDGTVTPMASGSTTLIRIGRFAAAVDNSAGTASTTVLVALDHEVVAEWYDNATGANAVLATDLFNDVYGLDDHTVTKASSGNSKVGRVWAVDAIKGVLIESYTL